MSIRCLKQCIRRLRHRYSDQRDDRLISTCTSPFAQTSVPSRMGLEMTDDPVASTVMDPILRPNTVLRVHSACSRAASGSTGAPRAGWRRAFCTLQNLTLTGRGRLESRSFGLTWHLCLYEGTTQPARRRQRTNSQHGSPTICTTQGCMAGLPSGGGKRGSVPFRAIKSADGIVEGAETVTGSYRTPSGTPGGAVHGPRTVPTASGSARANPRCGKPKGLL